MKPRLPLARSLVDRCFQQPDCWTASSLFAVVDCVPLILRAASGASAAATAAARASSSVLLGASPRVAPAARHAARWWRLAGVVIDDCIAAHGRRPPSRAKRRAINCLWARHWSSGAWWRRASQNQKADACRRSRGEKLLAPEIS